jgi:hypothetical protein
LPGSFHSTAVELRKQGIRIKLNAQPFQVLILLLQRPGKVLTREQIYRELVAFAVPAVTSHQFRTGTGVHGVSRIFALCAALARLDGCAGEIAKKVSTTAF